MAAGKLSKTRVARSQYCMSCVVVARPAVPKAIELIVFSAKAD